MPNTNRRGRATDERIRAAARQVLVARGLDMTIEDVAEAAGISRMTVHRHIGTRQALLMDVIVEATDRFAEQLAAIFDTDQPFADRLVEAFVYVVTATRSAPDQQAMALAIADPSNGWGGIDPEGRIMGEVLDFLRPRMIAGAAEAPFRSGVDETLAWLLRQAQLYLLVPGPLGDDIDGLRREVRTFVLPAVLVDPPRAASRRAGNRQQNGQASGRTTRTTTATRATRATRSSAGPAAKAKPEPKPKAKPGTKAKPELKGKPEPKAEAGRPKT